jgi:hypothetical protein
MYFFVENQFGLKFSSNLNVLSKEGPFMGQNSISSLHLAKALYTSTNYNEH